ncbi:unnamed protein product [Onchocerca ochengi]|uniref:Uncharacterized protein n=1 Tax=Onchocerca ochengi TaxID=42157 RepID=A0A182EM61_ONCOC|nr:unnamed protein product [Onchocerca ochengi]
MLLFVIVKYSIALIIITISLIAQTDATLFGLTATCSAGVTGAGKSLLGGALSGGGLLTTALGLGVGAVSLAAKFFGPRPSKKPKGRPHYLYIPGPYGFGCPCYPGYPGNNCWCGVNYYGPTPHYYYNNPYQFSCNNYQSSYNPQYYHNNYPYRYNYYRH